VTRPEERHALVVDLGTGGPKVALASLTGEIAWSEHHPVETVARGEGAFEQDAEQWWALVAGCARRALSSGVVRPEQVVAVNVTGQWASTVPVDGEGRAVAPCVMWMDTRGGSHSRRLFGGPVSGYHPRKLYEWVRRSGGAPSLDGADPIGHLLFLREERPDVWRSARWMLEPVDYLTTRFTGRVAATHASMTAAWLTDNRRLDRLSYDPVLVGLSTLDETKLPPLRPTASVIGPVAPAVAEELGLAGDVQVVAGSPDLHATALGSGAVLENEAHLSLSSTSWISAHVAAKKTDVVHSIATIPGMLPGRYLIADNHETSGLAFQWVREALGHGGLSFAALDAVAAGSSPGSGGVIFTPWLAGERSPVADKRARGGFHNLSLTTSRADLVRAVLEGVALNDRWLHEQVERFAGCRLDAIRVVGGGAVSELWCRIHADVMDRTIHQVVDPARAALRGAALTAALALGAVRPGEMAGLVPVERVFAPDPANRATYDALYAEFPGLYKAQRRAFHRLNPA
jgi:xylulokinase